MDVTVLAGGVGAARFLEGLVQVIEPARVTAIVNVGDDTEFYGLHISPDLDTVMYTLAGMVNPDQGWGVEGDTFACQQMLGQYGSDTWFRLGDRDLATHIRRSELLRQGLPLSQVTAKLAQQLGIRVRLLPMTDHEVRTRVRTPAGTLASRSILCAEVSRTRF